MSTAALVLRFGFGPAGATDVLVAMILLAATLAQCLGCRIFGLL